MTMVVLKVDDCELLRLDRKVTRLGVIELWFDADRTRYYVSCHNRTYHSGLVPIPATSVPRWRKEFA